MIDQEYLDMASTYSAVLTRERDLRVKLAEVVRDMEVAKVEIVSQALSEGLIDGKNAEIRSVQEKSILNCNKELIALSINKAALETELTLAEVDRRHSEALISITKAWLYSQSRIGD